MALEVIKLKKQLVNVCVRNVSLHTYHWHDTIALLYVLKGEILLKVWSGEYILKSKDVVVINVGEVYHLRGITDDNMILILHFDVSYCHRIIDNFENIFFYCNSVINEKFVPEKYKILRQYTALLISELCIERCANCGDHSITIPQICDSFLKFLSFNFNYISSGWKLRRFDKKYIERYTKIYKYAVYDNFAYKTTLKEIAQYVNVSHHYLSRDIRQKFGFTYQSIRNSLMGEHAIKLLLSTDKNILDICYESGFSDPKYLTKYFKAHYQCTPSELRQYHQNNCITKVKYREYSLLEYRTLNLNFCS